MTLKIHKKPGNAPNTTKSLGWTGMGMDPIPMEVHRSGREWCGKRDGKHLEMLSWVLLYPVDSRKNPIFALDWEGDGSSSYGSARVWKGIMREEGWETSGNAELGIPASHG